MEFRRVLFRSRPASLFNIPDASAQDAVHAIGQLDQGVLERRPFRFRQMPSTGHDRPDQRTLLFRQRIPHQRAAKVVLDRLALRMEHVEPFRPLLGLVRSEEHTSELQSLMRISYAVFCLKKKKKTTKLDNCTRSVQQVTTTENHNRNVHTTHVTRKNNNNK